MKSLPEVYIYNTTAGTTTTTGSSIVYNDDDYDNVHNSTTRLDATTYNTTYNNTNNNINDIRDCTGLKPNTK